MDGLVLAHTLPDKLGSKLTFWLSRQCGWAMKLKSVYDQTKTKQINRDINVTFQCFIEVQ